MERFPCPTCGKVLKYVEEKAGKPGICPRCGERVMTPAPAPPEEPADETPGLLASMSPRVRLLASALALVSMLGLLAALSSVALPDSIGLGEAAAFPSMLFSACCLLVLGLVFHGQATGCPSCGWWWTRNRAEKSFVDKEVFDEDGSTRVLSHYRTTYYCSGCRHRWSEDEVEEYGASPRPRRPHRVGR